VLAWTEYEWRRHDSNGKVHAFFRFLDFISFLNEHIFEIFTPSQAHDFRSDIWLYLLSSTDGLSLDSGEGRGRMRWTENTRANGESSGDTSVSIEVRPRNAGIVAGDVVLLPATRALRKIYLQFANITILIFNFTFYKNVQKNIQENCSWIENIRSSKPCKYILGTMFSILEQNGAKKKVKLSLFNNFLISLYYWLD